MPRFSITGAAALITILGTTSTVAAMCKAGNGIHIVDDPPTDSPFCLYQGEGSWTFTMQTTDIEVPTFDAAAPNAGAESATTFIIYDHACNLMGVYGQPGCEIPYTIEDYFLPYVLTITDINTATGFYSFTYGDGEYTINNNHCKCYDASHGLTGEKACRCAFPIDGVYSG